MIDDRWIEGQRDNEKKDFFLAVAMLIVCLILGCFRSLLSHVHVFNAVECEGCLRID